MRLFFFFFSDGDVHPQPALSRHLIHLFGSTGSDLGALAKFSLSGIFVQNLVRFSLLTDFRVSSAAMGEGEKEQQRAREKGGGGVACGKYPFFVQCTCVLTLAVHLRRGGFLYDKKVVFGDVGSRGLKGGG